MEIGGRSINVEKKETKYVLRRGESAGVLNI
jgi:hypothetical protein